MPIRSSRYYNDPNIGQAFSNLAAAFAPPSGSDLAGYATANAKREEAARLSELYSAAGSTNFDQAKFDRRAMAAGLWNPTQSLYAQDQNNATTRYGLDTQAGTSRANNAADNERALIEAAMQGAMAPVSQDALRPGFNPQDWGVAGPVVPEFAGPRSPLSETEWTAAQNERLRQGGQFTDDMMLDTIMGQRAPVEAIGANGQPQFMSPGAAVRSGAQPAPKGGESSAAQDRIARLKADFLGTGAFADPRQAESVAIGIVDGRLRADRHPVTGEVQVVDMATGRPVPRGSINAAPDGSETTSIDPGGPASRFPAADQSFGLSGALTGLVNRATDVAGFGPAYPAVQQTQSGFAVLRETLLNDIGTAYNRQPPSWLLRQIQDLTPDAGNPLEGPGAAQSKLTALDQHLGSELQLTEQALQRDLSPTNRQELEARRAGLQASIGRIQGALTSFSRNTGAGPGAPAGAAQEPPRVGSDADYEALPSGTTFRDPEGNLRRKP
ncbi:hypothetical protein SAMN02983003_3857 [Devosia enhydra]|uniref:Uncharacterized protein n=1 Tax=Devosia enhydra TaxID=665118 RepID=A0A1K2I360_9HYPH|nr:hypothetical protein [Devosia enhydra]SFZ86663.1 hypothetical protein SAMN02983003_3857 [Devosia enhydra]